MKQKLFKSATLLCKCIIRSDIQMYFVLALGLYIE